jgi:glycosidase
MPTMNVFTNGRTLSELNQVFAAGHHLALLNANLPDADYIRKLVKIRQEYKDALIHGRQVFQPSTGTDTVSAYYYRGSTSEVITVSNHGAADYAGELALDAAQGNSEWKDLLGMEALHATNTSLHVKVAAGGLAVLARDEKERIIAR